MRLRQLARGHGTQRRAPRARAASTSRRPGAHLAHLSHLAHGPHGAHGPHAHTARTARTQRTHQGAGRSAHSDFGAGFGFSLEDFESLRVLDSPLDGLESPPLDGLESPPVELDELDCEDSDSAPPELFSR